MIWTVVQHTILIDKPIDKVMILMKLKSSGILKLDWLPLRYDNVTQEMTKMTDYRVIKEIHRQRN